MPLLSSKKNERRLLALLLQSPTHMRALSMSPKLFVNPVRKRAGILIQKYVRRYKAVPSLNTLRTFAENINGSNVEDSDKILDVFAELDNLPAVAPSDATFEFEQAENYKIGRALFDVAADIKDKLEGGTNDFLHMRRDIISGLLAATTSGDTVTRGMIYDHAKARFEEYKDIAAGKVGDVIPFGMVPVDERLGGMRKTFVTLIYSKTGGGKTRTAINVAYNAAIAGYNVMYITLEMAFNLLASCFDSRIGWVDSNKIIFGKLDKGERKRYANALRQQVKDKLNIYIVDVSMGAKSSLILEEIEMYKAARGIAPDLVVVDYANIMEPDGRYQGRSEKYDNLFKEYHEIAKFANVALLTATQESRDASKEDIEARKKNAEIEQGVHKIGMSNFMAPHCETVLRLKQDSADKLNNRLWMFVDKCRYGQQGSEIPLTALWGKSYVGDRVVNNETSLKIYKLKQPEAYKK